jgi:hypothetical protein
VNSALITTTRQLDPATLAKRRLALKHKALGSAAAAIPFSVVSLFAHGITGNGASIGPWTTTVVFIAVAWILIAVVYVVCALRLFATTERERRQLRGLCALP